MRQGRKGQLKQLLKKLPLGVADEAALSLIDQALTHPSYVFEAKGGVVHNQRLEFLGDAVLGLVIARYLYEKFPHKTEGELTKMRSALVCEASLVVAAQTLRLGDYLLLGKGEEQMGGAARVSNLADSLEALLGALYLSAGLEKTSEFVFLVLEKQIAAVMRGWLGDYKTELQEYIQKEPQNSLQYAIIAENGPDHDKEFVAAVYLNGTEWARGRGKTKKEAEQKAAEKALTKIVVSG